MAQKAILYTGTIMKVFYHEEGNPWSSVLVELTDGTTMKASGKFESVSVGANVEMSGTIETDPRYGESIKVRKGTRVDSGTSFDGVIAYLSSSHFKYVGAKVAAAIVAKFKDKTIETIENHPEKLETIPGIKEARSVQIKEAHKEHKEDLPFYNLFHGDITEYQIKMMKKAYGKEALSVIKTDPYRLIRDIDGFGFKRVDAIALKSGIAKNDNRRVGAAIEFQLSEWTESGHCFGLLDELAGQVSVLTGAIPDEQMAEVLKTEIDNGYIVYEPDTERVFLTRLYEAEKYCGKRLGKMASCQPVKKIAQAKIDQVLREMEAENGFGLTKKQEEAVRSALRNRISIITGGPGTGKSTIVKAILRAWDDEAHIRLVAPTGKASRRMSEVTDGIPASTIHRLLGRNDAAVDGQGHLVVCDEASMLDIELAAKLIKYVTLSQSSLVLIGDVDQLPPIGPGNFFRDAVKSPCIPTVKLDLSHRQHGYIARNAASINQGAPLSRLTQDETFVYLESAKEDALNMVVNEYVKLSQIYPLKDICCILPMRKGNIANDAWKTSTRCVSDVANQRIRAILNPETGKNATYSGCPYRVGDRVIQTKNDYNRDVFNGDCGTIIGSDAEEEILMMELDDERIVEVPKANVKELDFAYALTVHKVQGSEYKAIVMANCNEHYIMLQRNLLYTGLTRSREKAILIGEKWAINQAIKNVDSTTRNSTLKEWIEVAVASGEKEDGPVAWKAAAKEPILQEQLAL